jgi:hypothetical protein
LWDVDEISVNTRLSVSLSSAVGDILGVYVAYHARRYEFVPGCDDGWGLWVVL